MLGSGVVNYALSWIGLGKKNALKAEIARQYTVLIFYSFEFNREVLGLLTPWIL
jgi:hypothetical protein